MKLWSPPRNLGEHALRSVCVRSHLVSAARSCDAAIARLKETPPSLLTVQIVDYVSRVQSLTHCSLSCLEIQMSNELCKVLDTAEVCRCVRLSLSPCCLELPHCAPLFEPAVHSFNPSRSHRFTPRLAGATRRPLPFRRCLSTWRRSTPIAPFTTLWHGAISLGPVLRVESVLIAAHCVAG